jgi:hypothetical protein
MQLETVSQQINEVLNFGKDVEIPKAILADLDKIVNMVELPENETQLTILQPNIAIVLVQRSNATPVAGLVVDKIVDGFEDNSINTFNIGLRINMLQSVLS